LDADIVLDLLTIYKIPFSRLDLAVDETMAVKISKKMGFPVVLKVASEDIPHKSDVGGVLLNLNNPEDVRLGYKKVINSARGVKADARIEGVHIQRMLPPGQEVIIGSVRDPQFGPLIMFGSGGVEVEGLKDIAFSLAPLTLEDASNLIDSTWAGRKFAGFRSIPAADRLAVMDIMVKLSHLAADLPVIQEIEINPVRVLHPGKGAVAVDVRAKL
jgi:acyl-CoA synthetase (NDP forming)